MLRAWFITVFLFARVSGHAVLRDPTPRQGRIDDDGEKLSPFSAASDVANRGDGGYGCGGSSNNDPGQQLPTEAFQPGEKITVKWKVTITHPRDVEDSGVRIAIHYSNSDSFQDNILAGELADDDEGGSTVSACEGADDDDCGDDKEGESFTKKVTLPDKTCSCCTLQWLWAAKEDGGFYLGCADIAITEDGELPTSCDNDDDDDDDNGGGSSSSFGSGDSPDGRSTGDGEGESDAATITLLILAILVVCACGCWCYSHNFFSPPPAVLNPPQKKYDVSQSSAAPPAKTPRRTTPATPEERWQEVKAPDTGDVYFWCMANNETSWDVPAVGVIERTDGTEIAASDYVMPVKAAIV